MENFVAKKLYTLAKIFLKIILPNMLPPTAARPPILIPAKKPTGPPRQVPSIAPAIGYTLDVENPSL
jgi:hypothetical protein